MHGAVCRKGVVLDPRTVEFLGRDFRAESEDIRLTIVRHDGVTAHIVDLGGGDRGRGRIAFVAALEQQETFDIKLAHELFDARDAVGSHAVEIDPLLVIYLHHPVCTGSHNCSPLVHFLISKQFSDSRRHRLGILHKNR